MAIIGVGPSIGMSLARRFGREGYRIGLVSRSQANLDAYVKELADLSIESVGFSADVYDRPGLVSAIEKIVSHFGPIDVLEYSPLMSMDSLVNVLSLDVEHAQSQLDMQVLGAITCVRAVLDGMLQKGDGALLFTLGASAYSSAPSHSNGALGVVAMKQYALMLNTALEPKGIYAGCLAIGQPPHPDEIADIYWEKVQKRQPCETLYGDPRVHAAYEVLLAQGVGRVYPPGLIGKLPTPRNDRERNIYLIGLYHMAECAQILGEGQEKVDEVAEIAESIGGNRSAPLFGANIDLAFPPVTTV